MNLALAPTPVQTEIQGFSIALWLIDFSLAPPALAFSQNEVRL